jgi:amidase
MSDILGDHDATGLAELVRRGEVKPLELVDAAIARVEAVDPQLNAVIHRRFEAAREEAAAVVPAGPFGGVPFLVKDLGCHTAGEPLHQGMALLRDAGWRAVVDSHLMTRFRAAGLVVIGRTNTPELGIQPTTEPSAYGPTRNPWDTRLTPGGSSGGAAAAVASGMVPAAHANDGGGSIRIPASACGLVGLKSSRGRVSVGPHGYAAAFLISEGVVCRTVRDAAGFLDATSGAFPGDPWVAPPPNRPFAAEVGADPGRLRIGLRTRAPGGKGDVHPECVRAAAETAALLESLGHEVVPGGPEAFDLPDWAGNFMTLWSANVTLALEEIGARLGRKVQEGDVEPLTWALAETGRQIPAARLIAAQTWLTEAGRRLGQWFAGPRDHSGEPGFDALLTPTLAEPPPPLGTFGPQPGNVTAGLFRAGAFCPFTPPVNTTGLPAVSLPVHETPEGLPVGVQLIAAYGREDVLLRLAAQVEAARPWRARRPPVHAMAPR